MIGREIRGLFSVPLAFIGGFFGTVVLSGLMILLMMFPGSSDADAAAVEDEFLLEFEPGALTKLGEEPKEIPEKPIHEETRTPDEAVEEAVTEEEKPPEQEIEKKDEKEIKKDDKPKNQNEKAKISDKNQKDNNPYDDIPNEAPETGDPFGDPNGWSELKKDGDPWATSVMAALNNMKVPAWAGKLPHGKPYKFMLKICKDGKVDQVLSKGSSGNTDLDNAILGELKKLKIPKPPPKILAQMPSNCVTLKYQFSWQQGKVK
ncbi:MAG: hypothetical protein HC927_12860 [Deltaproteobacteria bacterium]|nr:hypothetical protein [Deltaproteobacteria bacterium]